MKRLSALVATVVLALCFGASQAAAMEGGSGAGQDAGQSAGSGQSASGGSGAYQLGPSNSAGSIRVLSPGDNGSVSQSNNTTAGAVAANLNKTDQSVDQSQTGGGGYGSDSTQIAGQEAKNAQHADADATAKQLGAKNDALSIRVLSPGDAGDVTQSNSVGAGALAANGNQTDQTVDQSQAGGGKGSDSTQIAGQDASNKQSADADAKAVQVKPTNSATSIRVLSPGDDGNVTQSNNTTALAAALNGNKTDQSIDQSQGGASKEPAKAEDAKSVYPSGSSYTQIAGQSADSKQSADADAKAVQIKPTNDATSIRVLSPGDDGDVTQSNNATALGIAANGNETSQSTTQSQSGSGYGSDYAQIAGQEAGNYQKADADATAVQVKPTNTATSIRVLSPGDDGDVTQSNNATALAAALNLNDTEQTIDQQQTGSGHGSDYLQIAGQGAWSGQHADADAKAIQLGAKNEYTPVRVGSPNGKDKKHGKDEHGKDAKKAPHGGSVEQSNSVGAFGLALNLNKTYQPLEQSQTGHGSSGLQVGGQGVWSGQDASADVFGLQGVMRSKK
ncbi:MAG TPA: hypothetical protein VL264_01065 [Gaiella sp.]|nr:hypothetical protein [Gaiella sp.]